ncbi:hypothetical protein SteCoe_21727 [Stentor coeruleus]|uniref:Uncharacterized protein n=1 Tax=Stentor coeruleus TaxID=5963 RepID=A0A1R2BP00_9CILI|nr:hypothetical protein SteCoe_21727 [Stentor coeruleus]
MFDYQYGVSTTKYKEKLKTMLPKLKFSTKNQSKTLSLVFRFIHGLEVLQLSLINKNFYSASWDASLWNDLSKQLGNDKIDFLYSKASRSFDDFAEKILSQVSHCSRTIKWRIVYINLLYKFCVKCDSSENKLRFLPILQRTLCFKCARSPEFSMISLENAQSEYGVKIEEIQRQQLEGLKVPHTHESEKYMYVFYTKDILNLVKMDPEKRKKIKMRTNVEEKRRTEIVYHMQKEGIDNDYINEYLNIEGSLPHNYVLGKSRQSANKIAQSMVKIYEKDKEKKLLANDGSDEEQGEVKKKIVLSEEEKIQRKVELIERLNIMGINTENINFDEKKGLIYMYINGRVSRDLGYVAGVVWKQYKPVFTGVSGKTTQRIKDL